MGFVEDEEKAFAEGIRAEASISSNRRNKNKWILFVLIILAVGGASMVLYRFVGQTTTDDIFVGDPQAKRELVARWERVGFVSDFNVATSTCHFNDDRWAVYTEEEKRGVALILVWSFAERAGTGKTNLTIKGSLTEKILAIVGECGVELR